MKQQGIRNKVYISRTVIYVQKLHGFRNEIYRAFVTAKIEFLTRYFKDCKNANQGSRNEFQ